MDLIPKELERVRTAIKIRYGQWPKDRLRLCGLEMILNLIYFQIYIFIYICIYNYTYIHTHIYNYIFMYKDNVIYLQDSPCV